MTRNVPGVPYKCLSAFARRDISLTKIESLPLKWHPYEYRFYVDTLGVPSERNCANALRHLEEMTEFLAVRGSYSGQLQKNFPAGLDISEQCVYDHPVTGDPMKHHMAGKTMEILTSPPPPTGRKSLFIK